ncbi:hypothetical protein TNIN_343041 [Trichonephila inaurata madagascariensis]|uniref:Uncharacterized protein n=1 Tax=Trichonephila inaurata madagascariensis TaxID=2747483 RepID=A0A8X7BSN7_9ARAC|nr:hypothetical protein TNIN_343041 [Trichonephila inaurata madagascariensis]
MIERVHRKLNAPLMCHPDPSWLEALPVVLLGLHSVFKDDLQSSSAVLVFGEPLSLPEGLFLLLPPRRSKSKHPRLLTDLGHT